MKSESWPPRLLPALTIPRPSARPAQSRDSPTGLLASLTLWPRVPLYLLRSMTKSVSQLEQPPRRHFTFHPFEGLPIVTYDVAAGPEVHC